MILQIFEQYANGIQQASAWLYVLDLYRKYDFAYFHTDTKQNQHATYQATWFFFKNVSNYVHRSKKIMHAGVSSWFNQ